MFNLIFFLIDLMISFDQLQELLSDNYIKEIRVEPRNYSQRIRLSPGIYSVECWGAQGGSNPNNNKNDPQLYGGNGSYTFGMVRFETRQIFYAYVGLRPEGNEFITFAGAGGGDISGGGATDLRLIDGDSLKALKSRIIVAAGGGGADNYEDGGNGGDFIGGDSGRSKGATQTSGGTGFYNGTFGKGGGVEKRLNDSTGGGGGGYYGGGSGITERGYSGSGGSSYISGLDGCIAVENDDSDPPTPSCSSIHYSSITFYNSIMINGNSKMPSHEDYSSLYERGNSGSGFMRIRMIERFDYETSNKNCYLLLHRTIVIMMLSSSNKS